MLHISNYHHARVYGNGSYCTDRQVIKSRLHMHVKYQVSMWSIAMNDTVHGDLHIIQTSVLVQ